MTLDAVAVGAASGGVFSSASRSMNDGRLVPIQERGRLTSCVRTYSTQIGHASTNLELKGKSQKTGHWREGSPQTVVAAPTRCA